MPPLQSRPVRLALKSGVLQGQVAVREAADGTLWLLDAAPGKDPKAVHFGTRVPLVLRWAALRASTDAPVRVALLTAKGLAPWNEAVGADELATTLNALVEFREAVLAGERRYSPATSWAAANAADDEDEAIVAAWAGSDFSTGERDYAPGYAALLGRDWALQAGSDALRDFQRDACALAACLPPGPDTARAASTDGADE